MTSAAKVIFFSRHAMTVEQAVDLERQIMNANPGEYSGIEVLSKNVMFPALAEDACEMIMKRAKEVDAEYITGVFPAHVAVELYRNLGFNDNPLFMYCPVSLPAPAVEGETRGGGFVHSHWELFCAE